jgi:hypothetical protein
MYLVIWQKISGISIAELILLVQSCESVVE